MAKLLKNLKVTKVSILTGEMTPANGESVIIKDDNSFQLVFKAESCTLEGILKCVVMKSETPDTDDDVIEVEEVKNAGHQFMIDLQKGVAGFDINHDMKNRDGIYVIEAGLSNDNRFEMTLNVAENEELMKAAKDKQINGVSIYGKAEKVEKAGKEFNFENESYLRQFYNWAKSKFEKPSEENINKNKTEDQDMTKDELKAMLAEINKDSANEAEAVAKAAKQTELEASVKTLTETVEKQAKTIEDLAKARTTETGTSGIVTKEDIFKCDDPKKAAELTEIYKSQQKGK